MDTTALAQVLRSAVQPPGAPPPTGLAAVVATHAQLDPVLTQTLIALAAQGERIAVITADNHFDAAEIARRVDAARLHMARGETPHQVRTLVRRLHARRASYSVVVLVGLLTPFYDEQVKWTLARYLLADTLRLLQELAEHLQVLVVLTPAPHAARPWLHAQVRGAAERYLELPALSAPELTLPPRLF